MVYPQRRQSQRSNGSLLILAAAAFCVLQALMPSDSMVSRGPGLTQVPEPPPAEKGFLTKVAGAAVQGMTAAIVAAILSACTEPIVNRLLVKRMTFGQAWSEITFKLVSNFFLTTFPTNMLKFPVFEVINMAMQCTSLAGSVRGIVSGFLFCSVMLPVTNYRFRKSMGWEVKLDLLYQAYIPTVARDIVYGWARNVTAGVVTSMFAPESHTAKAVCFGITVWAACIISSPGNEWRGYTLQPKDRKLPFAEYFKPVNYARSTGIGASIMGIALCIGNIIVPYAEALFAICKGNPMYTAAGVVVLGVVVGAMNKK
mmetsp:Transcript_102987/g.220252  ORF Transcript_102987/g.220252 Transcript_102987/m.220252 type:complete len:313 (-) Transcript_102987:193-1131(-)